MQRLIPVIAIVLIASMAAALRLEAQDDDCAVAGTLSRETYFSSVSSHERKYTIYLPPCYDALEERYPLLLLLHGSDANDSQWTRLGFLNSLESAIHQGSAPPMIVLMPYGGSIANRNRFNGISYDAILRDLVNQAEGRYRANGARAIGGISRGGFWAYQLGLRFPNDFIAIGGHSPYFDRDHAEPADNPLYLARQLRHDTHLRLWLDRGTNDHASDGIEQMRIILQEGEVPHDYVVHAGGDHSEATWRRFVDDYLQFYASAFAGDGETASAETAGAERGVELWLPAAGFGALRASIDSADLGALIASQFDERLVLGESHSESLRGHGIELHPRTRIVPDDKLFYTLWRDKASFTLLPFDQLHLRLRPLWLDDVPVVDQLARYPLVFQSANPNFRNDELTRITLSGTTALARHTLSALAEIGVEQAASGIGDYVRRSDIFHMSHEASIAPSCPQHTDAVLGGVNSMCMQRDHARLFDILDVDVVDLTGNHINDFGYQAFAETLDHFEARGFGLVGGGRNLERARQPLILERNGTRIGWLACNHIGPYYAFANDDPAALGGRRPGNAYCRGGWLRDALPLLAAEVDIVLMTVQYREFDAFQPERQQRLDFQTYAEWGADIVVGTAEHKPMTFEFYQTRRGETAFIHYGLGNLFFDQLPWGNRRFFLDTLYIYEGRLLTVELYPGIIDDRARPRLLAGEDLYNFLHFIFVQKNEF
ncbi:MAG: CapA family protein [Chloroflexota bacterium]|nr:CapA family protein [Chloroflexota bacterium]MDE2909128.1 CapA family protein [Chloroflexota bacterium]